MPRRKPNPIKKTANHEEMSLNRMIAASQSQRSAQISSGPPPAGHDFDLEKLDQIADLSCVAKWKKSELRVKFNLTNLCDKYTKIVSEMKEEDHDIINIEELTIEKFGSEKYSMFSDNYIPRNFGEFIPANTPFRDPEEETMLKKTSNLPCKNKRSRLNEVLDSLDPNAISDDALEEAVAASGYFPGSLSGGNPEEEEASVMAESLRDISKCCPCAGKKVSFETCIQFKQPNLQHDQNRKRKQRENERRVSSVERKRRRIDSNGWEIQSIASRGQRQRIAEDFGFPSVPPFPLQLCRMMEKFQSEDVVVDLRDVLKVTSDFFSTGGGKGVMSGFIRALLNMKGINLQQKQSKLFPNYSQCAVDPQRLTGLQRQNRDDSMSGFIELQRKKPLCIGYGEKGDYGSEINDLKSGFIAVSRRSKSTNPMPETRIVRKDEKLNDMTEDFKEQSIHSWLIDTTDRTEKLNFDSDKCVEKGIRLDRQAVAQARQRNQILKAGGITG